MRITEDIKIRILELRKINSISEIARIIGCSQTSVKNVLRKSNFIHSADNSTCIRSRVRKQMIRDERRRALFGLDQKSNIKVFSNKDRISLRYCLKRKGYLFMSRGANIAYYNTKTIRDSKYEEKGMKLGLRFHSLTT